YGTIGAGQNIYLATIDSVDRQLIGRPKPISNKYVGLNFGPAWSPDRKSVAYIIDRGAGYGFSGRAIVIQSLITHEERELPHPGVEIAGFRVHWSPDGKALLSFGIDRGQPPRSGIFQVDPQTGNGTFLAKRGVGSNEGLGGFGWFPDGQHIFRLQYSSE